MTARRLGVLFAPLLLAGCASHYGSAAADPYGFFFGIWHGLISPYAVIANLLSWALGLAGISFPDSVQIIGRPNTGFFYYLGFFFGLVPYSGGAAQAR